MRRESNGATAHRQALPQEPHVGHTVVDLGQHVLQVLGRDPGVGQRGNTFRSCESEGSHPGTEAMHARSGTSC